MRVHSAAFGHQSEIPSKYTCEGANTSPPIAWEDVPTHAESLALVMDDPDAPDPKAPKRTWVHWVIYDIAPNLRELTEDAARTGLPDGCQEAKNDWGKKTYGGPCPPIGRHRYFIKLYALDTPSFGALAIASKADLERAMAGHILAEAQMYGTYQKKKP